MDDENDGTDPAEAAGSDETYRLEAPVSRCPRCDSPVTVISVIGPDDQFVSPCGCRLTPGQIERL